MKLIIFFNNNDSQFVVINQHYNKKKIKIKKLIKFFLPKSKSKSVKVTFSINIRKTSRINLQRNNKLSFSTMHQNSPQGFLLKYEQHFTIGWQVTRIRESHIREATWKYGSCHARKFQMKKELLSSWKSFKNIQR